MSMESIRYRGRLFGCIALMLAGVYSGNAQQPSGRPEEILSPDGSIRPGTVTQGSYRTDGSRLEIGPHGEPLLRSAVSARRNSATPAGDTADVHWDSRFAASSGFNGPVFAIFVDGRDVYFGGSFTAVGGVPTNNIVKWDGVSWSPLGGGVNGVVYAIAKFQNEIYAGGYFSSAGGIPATSLAKWDGQNWSTLGTYPNDGVPGDVRGMVALRDSLYIAGRFTWYDTLKVDGTAIWNGTTISAMPGTNTYTYHVSSLATDGTNIYVGGGYFQFWDGVQYTNGLGVARWDGNAWGILGNVPDHAGVHGKIYCVTWWNGSLYVGGSFDSAGVVSANNIARWNGTAWSSIGSGLNKPVNALLESGTKIYAGGNFTASGIDTMNGVAMYDTLAGIWTPIANGVLPGLSFVSALAGSASTLYMGGSLSYWSNSYATGDGVDYYAALLSGGTFSFLGTTPVADGLGGNGGGGTPFYFNYQEVNAFAVSGDLVYVGGNFTAAGGIRANNIACWNNATKTWSPLGDGVDGSVTSIAVVGTDLYAAGLFYNAGGSPANLIARWDGSSWHPLGSPPNDGVQGDIFDILAFSGKVYVTGYIYNAGGSSISHIAVWDGSTWSGLGSGLDFYGSSLAVYHNDLYVGGGFTHAGGTLAMYIAKWDGVSWNTVGAAPDTGMNGPVLKLNVVGNDLYAGGQFSVAGPISANNIARWNGTSWSSLGSGLNGGVRAIEASGSSVYAGGDFTGSGVLTVNHIARYDTSSATWASLGSGANDKVFTLKFAGNDLFAGGFFQVAGGKGSSTIGIWNPALVSSVPSTGSPVPASFSLSQNYPNPFNPGTTIGYTVRGPALVTLKVFDILGREVATLVNERKTAGSYEVRFDGSRLASGVYFYQLKARQGEGGQAETFVETRKLLLLR